MTALPSAAPHSGVSSLVLTHGRRTEARTDCGLAAKGRRWSEDPAGITCNQRIRARVEHDRRNQETVAQLAAELASVGATGPAECCAEPSSDPFHNEAPDLGRAYRLLSKSTGGVRSWLRELEW